MTALLPFRATIYSDPVTYIPGEETVPAACPARHSQLAAPALYIYKISFGGTVREGVTGLLDRTAAPAIFLHEETLPDRVAACAEALRNPDFDPGTLWLWCHDESRALAPLLQTHAPPDLELTDQFGANHQMWRISEPILIEQIQTALAGKELFLADGHHRFAAGWNLATIQIRTAALRSLPSHRLVQDAPVNLPMSGPIQDLDAYRAATPAGYIRYGLFLPGEPMHGFEIPLDQRHHLLRGLRVQPARSIDAARAAVHNGAAKFAVLVEAIPADEIEAAARRGHLLPPQSTDFFPKLAAGLVHYRHQNETVSPPVPHRRGVL